MNMFLTKPMKRSAYSHCHGYQLYLTVFPTEELLALLATSFNTSTQAS